MTDSTVDSNSNITFFIEEEDDDNENTNEFSLLDLENINKLLNREEEVAKIKEILSDFEANKHDLTIKKGIYIYGDPGSGKTTFITDILKELNYDIVQYLSCSLFLF